MKAYWEPDTKTSYRVMVVGRIDKGLVKVFLPFVGTIKVIAANVIIR